MHGTAAGHGCDPPSVALRFIALRPFLFCAACGIDLGPAPAGPEPGDMAFA